MHKQRPHLPEEAREGGELGVYNLQIAKVFDLM